ncbi:MAG: hypothetical protein ABJA67_17905 [Chthonomonadales bacterium]
MSPNIVIISGEISGDLVGGALAAEIAKRRPDLKMWGIGSTNMAEAGVELLYDSSQWSAIGIIEALRIYPLLKFQALPRMLRELEARKPSLIILIDFGAFNIRIATKKPQGTPVLYYFPPGSWKQHGSLNPQIAQVTDRIATQFPWSAERLKSIGANVTFVGHPLLDIVKPSLDRKVFAERFGLDPLKPIIGLLPGSRGHEIVHNTPAMLGSASILMEHLGDAQFVFGVASPQAREMIETAIETRMEDHREKLALKRVAEDAIEKGQHLLADHQPKMLTPEGILLDPSSQSRSPRFAPTVPKNRSTENLPPIVLVENMTYDVMAHSNALQICSGTATLEAAILGTPMSILYRGSKIMALEAKLRRIIPANIGMPNIIADRRIVPEFIQDAATPEALAAETLRQLTDLDYRSEMRRQLLEVRGVLASPSPEGATSMTANIALELCK